MITTGLISVSAEEVQSVEPLLTFRNDQGEIEGVKYNQLNVVLVNAINELTQKVEHLESLLRSQTEVISRLGIKPKRKHSPVKH